MANRNLSAAKSAKNDEFYTQYADIQKEVNAYLEYDPDVFRDKTILLPCDDPEWSNFTKFFAQNFERFGLKKLISTSYAIESKHIKTVYQPSLFEQEAPHFDKKKTRVKGKIFVLDHDTNANGRIDIEDLEWQYLKGDGDFRSDEVQKLRDEADIIVTNPPFSLFREFLAWIVGSDSQHRGTETQSGVGVVSRGDAETQSSRVQSIDGMVRSVNGRARSMIAPHGTMAASRPPKKFLIIGNMNAVTYKEVFPLIQANKMWLGNGFSHGNAYFRPVGDVSSYAAGVFDAATGLVKFRNVCWFTNIEHGRRHQPLSLMSEKDNIKYSKHKEIKGIGYKHYDNYDAIEVPFTDAIPSDYSGAMGVPISFLDKYCPEQFEILGISLELARPMSKIAAKGTYLSGGPRFYVTEKNGAFDHKRLYDRIVIRFRTTHQQS